MAKGNEVEVYKFDLAATLAELAEFESIELVRLTDAENDVVERRVTRDKTIRVQLSWGRYFQFVSLGGGIFNVSLVTFNEFGDRTTVPYGWWKVPELKDIPADFWPISAKHENFMERWSTIVRPMALDVDGETFIEAPFDESNKEADVAAVKKIVHILKLLNFENKKYHFGDRPNGIIPTDHLSEQKMLVGMITSDRISSANKRKLEPAIDANYRQYLKIRKDTADAKKAIRKSYLS